MGDAVEAERALSAGRRIVVRESLPAGATSISSSAFIAGGCLALIAGLMATALVRLRRTRSAKALARLVSAARVVAAGSGSLGELPQGELADASAAIVAARDRMAEMQAVADSQFDAVESVIGPLAAPVAARTPVGREVRSAALEALTRGLTPDDRYAVDVAVTELLATTGRPAGCRVELGGGRTLDVESWAVPGGRVCAVVERGEQERLRRLRRQLTGAAARHLRAPLAEIEARATELFSHVPADSAPPVQKILAAADRMDRLVTAMLRGTAHDPQARPPKLGPLSVSGLLWGLAQKWDRSLRPQALRVEVDIAPDLPPALADAALVEEILTEVIDNAAKYTPRGGTIELRGRRTDAAIELEVRDTGDGIAAAEVGNVTKPFFRGARSEVLPGAGLGLGVAAALAERIGGRLDVHPGPGGRVVLVLKAAPVTEEKALSASAA
jgi:signal transduction histidine kinase